jgi:hypothetical protein
LERIGNIFYWVFTVLLFFVGLVLTPLYFYVEKLYFMHMSGALFVPIVILSVLMITLSIAAIKYFIQRDLKKYWISMNASIILALFFAVTFVMPAIDVHKSFVPFCRQIIAKVPASEPLYAYEPDETLRGVVPFYTGRYVNEIEELASVEMILRKGEPFNVIIRDKREQTEKELLSTGRLTTIVKLEMGTDRTLVLLSNRAIQRQ